MHYPHAFTLCVYRNIYARVRRMLVRAASQKLRSAGLRGTVNSTQGLSFVGAALGMTRSGHGMVSQRQQSSSPAAGSASSQSQSGSPSRGGADPKKEQSPDVFTRAFPEGTYPLSVNKVVESKVAKPFVSRVRDYVNAKFADNETQIRFCTSHSPR